MTVSTAEMIAWMQARKGNVSYSMDHRDGPDSYDCSSAIYYCYRYKGNTETVPNQEQIENATTQFEREIANGVSLQNSQQPYFEATVSGDYWV